MIRVRKHEAMYAAYGELPQYKCRNCRHFIILQAGARRVSKCLAYGVTGSAASDWNGRKNACGFYNFPGECLPIMEQLKRDKQYQCDGQLEIAEL